MPPARPAAGPVSVLTTGLSLSEGFKATLINLYEQLASGTAFEGARAEVSMAPILVLRPGVVLVEEAQHTKGSMDLKLVDRTKGYGSAC